MSTRTRLGRLEEALGVTGLETVDNFFRLLQGHGREPAVSAAAEFFRERMRRLEAALGRPVAPREWLDDDWMDERGLTDAVNGLLRAVRAAAAATAASQEGAAP
jgi:hypothetical protein